MTLPDELTSAVVQSIITDRPDESPEDWEYVAKIAVAAVLRALPECETLVEELADVEHERWAKWMRWLYQHGKWHVDGTFTIWTSRAQRWRNLAHIAYADLDEQTKEHDRIEARINLAAIARNSGS